MRDKSRERPGPSENQAKEREDLLKSSSIEFHIIGPWKRIIEFSIVCSYLRKIIRQFRSVPCIIAMDLVYFGEEGIENRW